MMKETLSALHSDEQLFFFFLSFFLVQSQLVLLVYIPVS